MTSSIAVKIHIYSSNTRYPVVGFNSKQVVVSNVLYLGSLLSVG